MRASKVRKISSSWVAWRPAPAASWPPSGSCRLLAVAGRQLDVGLAEQRLLAQDRPRVGGDRRVGVVELDRRHRRVGVLALAELDLRHLADRDAGDPHVGLVREQARLGERNLDRVALRLQRRRPAEGDPEEQQQPEAGQGEAGDRGQLEDGWRLLLHQGLSGVGGQISAEVGTWVACRLVSRASFASAANSASAHRVAGERSSSPRRTGPSASWVRKIELKLWFSQGKKKRKPSSGTGGLKASWSSSTLRSSKAPRSPVAVRRKRRRRLGQVADRRLHLAGERADLVAERRQRLAEQLLARLQRRLQRLRAGISAQRGGAQDARELIRARQPVLGRPQGRRQLLQRPPGSRPAGGRRSPARRWRSRRTGPARCRCDPAPRRPGGSCGSSARCSAAAPPAPRRSGARSRERGSKRRSPAESCRPWPPSPSPPAFSSSAR